MNTHTEPTNDYPDTLLDRGLAELLGGETPPDLSERILAAANSLPSPTVTLAHSIPKSKEWREWKPLAVLCASIAVIGTVVGLMFPASVSHRDRTRTPAQIAQIEEKLIEPIVIPSRPSSQKPQDNWGSDGLINDRETAKSSDEVMMAATPHIIIQEEEEERLGVAGEEGSGEAKPAPALTPYAVPQNMSTPNVGTVITGGVKPESLREGQQREEASAPSISRDKMAEMVGKFNQLRDEHRYAEMDVVAKRLYDAAPDEPVAQQVWQNSKFIRRQMQGRELRGTSEEGFQNLEYRQKDSLGRKQIAETLQQSSAPIQYDAEKWQQLSARRKKYAAVELGDQLRHSSQRFRIDNAPGDNVDRYGREPNQQWGLGTEPSRDQYTSIHENTFITAIGPDAVSTFSIDVDTASYANVRQFLQQSRRLPPPDAVRIEELINYFDYDYAGPTGDTPFAAHMEIAGCPWNPEHRLARIAIKGRDIDRTKRPQSNLVFLIDVSGSMDEPNKLPLLVEGMKVFTRELGENDKVAIVVYASSEGLALNSTRGNEQETILAALDQLRAGGSTAGGAGINLAYQVALDNFIEGGTNRVILCTDGDFNVGVTSTDDLTRLAEEKAKTGVFLTVLGFGRGNLNDAMMESISGKGNGNYHYVDNLTEARKVLVEEMVGTLITIAKDVKIQVEFNPAQVAGYRLIGYENRMLKTEDFNNDKKDAGEIGAGHTVTALYEIVPAGQEVTPPSVDPLKYQNNPPPRYSGEANIQENSGEGSEKQREYGGEYGGRGGGEYGGTAKPQAASNELLTLKLRYKLPDADTSTKLEFPITDKGDSFATVTKDFQFAAAVASFGMLLRHSEHQGTTSYDAVLEIAQSALSNDSHGYRAEFLDLVRLAKELTGEQPSSTTDPSTTEGP